MFSALVLSFVVMIDGVHPSRDESAGFFRSHERLNCNFKAKPFLLSSIEYIFIYNDASSIIPKSTGSRYFEKMFFRVVKERFKYYWRSLSGGKSGGWKVWRLSNVHHVFVINYETFLLRRETSKNLHISCGSGPRVNGANRKLEQLSFRKPRPTRLENYRNIGSNLRLANITCCLDGLLSRYCGPSSLDKHPLGGFSRSSCVVKSFYDGAEGNGSEKNGSSRGIEHEFRPPSHAFLSFKVAAGLSASLFFLCLVYVGFKIADRSFDRFKPGLYFSRTGFSILAAVVGIGSAAFRSWLIFGSGLFLSPS